MSDSTTPQPTPEPDETNPAAKETAAQAAEPAKPPESEAPGGATEPDSSVTSSVEPSTTAATTSAEPTAPSPGASTEPSNPSAPAPSTPTAPAPAPTAPPAPPTAPPSPDEQWQPAAPKAEKRNPNVGIIAALAVGALIGGVSGAGVTAIAFNNQTPSAQSGPNATNITVNDPGNATTVTAVAASAAQSVVTISVRGEGSSGTGSGVFLTKDGYILTNAHVATLSGATSEPTVRVQTSDGHLYDATLVGSDPIADLAVVKIDVDGVEFQPVKFADSSDLNVGDTVVALGSPLGLSNTVTSGIVSALNRSITVASSAVPETEDNAAPDDNNNDGNGPFDFWEFDDRGQEGGSQATATIALPVIQTDAAINPGNSGGALLDSDGRLIGINVAIASAGGSQAESGNIGVGFAIPANLAKRISDELIETGKASHGLLGATVADVTEDADIASSATVGSSIQSVTPGGAADKAGLRKGDIVVEFNGLPITGKTDLTAQVRVLAGGSDAELVYVRNGKTTTVTVTLGEL